LLPYSGMGIQKLPSVKAVEKKLKKELSVAGKVTSVCHSYEWQYQGKKESFFVSPAEFGEQTIPIIKMSSWEYFGREELQKKFPQFAKEIEILDDIVSKYGLSMECIIYHEPNRYKPKVINLDESWDKAFNFIEAAGNTSDPDTNRYNIREVSGLITEALLEYHTVILQTSKPAFTIDDVIPAVYSQKEFIDLCTKNP